jgi:hypothetical protein
MGMDSALPLDPRCFFLRQTNSRPSSSAALRPPAIAGVDDGEGGAGSGVGGAGVGAGVGEGVGTGVGDGVGEGVGAGVGDGVGAGVGEGVGGGVGVVVQPPAPPMECLPVGHALQSSFVAQAPAGAAVSLSQVHGVHWAAFPVAKWPESHSVHWTVEVDAPAGDAYPHLHAQAAH